MPYCKHSFLIFFLLMGSLCSFADVRLPSLISSNMVLQQNSSAKLWGWSEPAEKIFITTSWNNKTDSVSATSAAKWEIQIPMPAAGGPYTITIKGKNEITLENVMIGEVWVCSGQSNMEMNYNWGHLQDIKAEFPTAHNENIRFFQIPKTTAEYPQDDCFARWTVCDSNTLKAFSAAAYFFGKKLSEELHVPVGLIESSWGGTPAEVWTPDSIVMSSETLKEAAAKLQPNPYWPHQPGYTYNAMIAPLTRYNIAGAIWYQGESNTNTASTYEPLFTSMISGWRAAWEKDLPFYFVQIAPFKYGDPNVGALLREAQMKSLSLPQTGMVVTTDIVADTNDIHPTDKHDVGLRLAALALSRTYGKTNNGSISPVYQKMNVDNDKVIINFNNLENGLATSDKKPVSELYIAGDDKVFHKAQASFTNNTLQVWSKEVKAPVAVRYGFSNTATGNLTNKEGLPVSPFRTDEWEVNTR